MTITQPSVAPPLDKAVSHRSAYRELGWLVLFALLIAIFGVIAGGALAEGATAEMAFSLIFVGLVLVGGAILIAEYLTSRRRLWMSVWLAVMAFAAAAFVLIGWWAVHYLLTHSLLN